MNIKEQVLGKMYQYAANNGELIKRIQLTPDKYRELAIEVTADPDQDHYYFWGAWVESSDDLPGGEFWFDFIPCVVDV